MRGNVAFPFKHNSLRELRRDVGAEGRYYLQGSRVVIPILDLTVQYRALKPQIDAAVEQVLESGIFIMGPNVAAFEKELATYLGVPCTSRCVPSV